MKRKRDKHKSTVFTCSAIVAHNNNMDDNICMARIKDDSNTYIEFRRQPKYTQDAANARAIGSCFTPEAFVSAYVPCVYVYAMDG